MTLELLEVGRRQVKGYVSYSLSWYLCFASANNVIVTVIQKAGSLYILVCVLRVVVVLIVLWQVYICIAHF